MKNFKLPIWVSNCLGNKENCRYPHENIAADEVTLKECLSKDHVFIKFKNNYRSKKNFTYADVIVLDCDNTHSDNPDDWYTPEDIAKYFPMVKYIAYTSRNHMKQKESRSPRPRFHIIFFIERVTDIECYEDMFNLIREYFPHFDEGAKDAARFFYGNPETEIYICDGMLNISQFLDVDAFVDMDSKIYQGSRNDTIFHSTIRSMTRFGIGKEARDWFNKQAERCEPPLDTAELRQIWKQCKVYYHKIASKPGYINADVYNGKIDPMWSEPIPFSASLKEQFPVDALPRSIADYIRAVSESTQTPVDMAGALSLAVISTCMQGKFLVRGKADWFEPVNTYVLAIAPPSERKSAVQKLMLKPINEYETDYNRDNANRVETSKMQKRILERRQKAVEDQMAKGKATQEEFDRIVDEITQFEEVTPMHIYVDDITTEKLVSVLSANKGRAAIISTEGGIFDTLAGIYTKNVNIDVMLKGYSGDPIRVDRIGRDSESILNPALTVLLMAQPNVVSEVLSNTTFRGRGLTARFLYCLPDSYVGTRKFNSHPIDKAITLRYTHLVKDMLDDEYGEEPEIITLSDEAEQLLAAFAEEIEPKLVKEYAEIADWVGKLVGNTLRISGLLCRASVTRGHDFLDVAEPLTVSGETMENAVRLGRYFLNHAQAAYSVLPEDKANQDANIILGMIQEKKLKKFDRREAMRNCRKFKTVAAIQPVLDFLEDYGYIAQIPEVNKPKMGRPPLPKYAVNPLIMTD